MTIDRMLERRQMRHCISEIFSNGTRLTLVVCNSAVNQITSEFIEMLEKYLNVTSRGMRVLESNCLLI